MEQRTEPSVAFGVPSTQRSLLDELQGIDMTSSAIPHPPQQLLQLQGAVGLSGSVASGAAAQADKPAQPPGLIPLVAVSGNGGTLAATSIFSKNLSHPQPQGGSLSTPSLWSSAASASNNIINLGDLGDGRRGKEKESTSGGIREPTATGGAYLSAKERLILQVMEEMEVTHDAAVEIIGGEEEEEEEVEVTKVVLIPTAQDNKTLFTNIFADTTIEPLEIKLRSIMDLQLNTTRLIAERGKVATSNFTLGVFRQRDVNDRPHSSHRIRRRYGRARHF